MTSYSGAGVGTAGADDGVTASRSDFVLLADIHGFVAAAASVAVWPLSVRGLVIRNRGLRCGDVVIAANRNELIGAEFDLLECC